MPYRRFPKTDSARIRALGTLLDYNSRHSVEGRFIDWKTVADVRTVYGKLSTAVQQRKADGAALQRFNASMGKLQHNATLYVSHFLQVLFMCVQRGEIRASQLQLYGLKSANLAVPNIKTVNGLLSWGKKTEAGEKARIAKGGRPIYNPSIGMVATHCDIFNEACQKQKLLVARVERDLKELEKLREQADEVILSLWNQIESHFASLPPEKRFDECRKYGVIYYYRRGEEKE